jgi:hypothetical protein
MKQTCKKCGKNCEGEYCFRHKPKKPLKATKGLTHNVEKDLSDTIEMRIFFHDIWNKKPHKSEVSGASLGHTALSVFFHHILPKEKYPQAALDEENIILLTLDEHTNVENDMYRYEEVNRRREQLKKKYDIQ